MGTVIYDKTIKADTAQEAFNTVMDQLYKSSGLGEEHWEVIFHNPEDKLKFKLFPKTTEAAQYLREAAKAQAMTKQ